MSLSVSSGADLTLENASRYEYDIANERLIGDSQPRSYGSGSISQTADYLSTPRDSLLIILFAPVSILYPLQTTLTIREPCQRLTLWHDTKSLMLLSHERVVGLRFA